MLKTYLTETHGKLIQAARNNLLITDEIDTEIQFEEDNLWQDIYTVLMTALGYKKSTQAKKNPKLQEKKINSQFNRVIDRLYRLIKDSEGENNEFSMMINDPKGLDIIIYVLYLDAIHFKKNRFQEGKYPKLRDKILEKIGSQELIDVFDFLSAEKKDNLLEQTFQAILQFKWFDDVMASSKELISLLDRLDIESMNLPIFLSETIQQSFLIELLKKIILVNDLSFRQDLVEIIYSKLGFESVQINSNEDEIAFYLSKLEWSRCQYIIHGIFPLQDELLHQHFVSLTQLCMLLLRRLPEGLKFTDTQDMMLARAVNSMLNSYAVIPFEFDILDERRFWKSCFVIFSNGKASPVNKLEFLINHSFVILVGILKYGDLVHTQRLASIIIELYEFYSHLIGEKISTFKLIYNFLYPMRLNEDLIPISQLAFEFDAKKRAEAETNEELCLRLLLGIVLRACSNRIQQGDIDEAIEWFSRVIPANISKTNRGYKENLKVIRAFLILIHSYDRDLEQYNRTIDYLNNVKNPEAFMTPFFRTFDKDIFKDFKQAVVKHLKTFAETILKEDIEHSAHRNLFEFKGKITPFLNVLKLNDKDIKVLSEAFKEEEFNKKNSRFLLQQFRACF